MATLGAFIIVLGIIIFVHEFGHFITAKAFGIRVFVFSFGFGKRLFGFQWGDTDCRVSLVPLGGYVKLEGEPDDPLTESASEDVRVLDDGTMVRVPNPNYFTNRPRWQRFLVYVAGPVMNVILTLVGFTTLYSIGWGVDPVLYDRPIIGAIDAGSPAEAAGFRPGDQIVSIDGMVQEDWESAWTNVLARPDREVKFRIRRGSEEADLVVRSGSTNRVGTIGVYPLVRIGQVVPGAPAEASGLKPEDGILRIEGQPVRSFESIVAAVGSAAAGKALSFDIYRQGEVQSVRITPLNGKVGIANKTIFRQLRFPAAVVEAFRETGRTTSQTLGMLRQLVTARISPRAGLSGPLEIAKASGAAARAGIRAFIYLITVLSLSVGILNLLPVAPLDGGHLAILLGEGVLRRDFSMNVKTWIMNAGAAAIFLLIGVVLYSDLSKNEWLGKFIQLP